MSAVHRVVVQAAPLRAQVVDALRDDIVEGRLRPGDRLREAMLCERYGVSRTVVREALRQLESERLISMLPNRGPIVTVLEEHEIHALYEVRRELEGLVGELFARRCSDELAASLVEHYTSMHEVYLRGSTATREESKRRFYALLLEGSGNVVLSDTLSGIHQRVAILRHVAFLDDARVAASMIEIGRIVDAAARRRDPNAARKACEEHIRHAGALATVDYCAWLARLRAS